MKHRIKKQKTAADNTGDKSSITPREIEKEKDIRLWLLKRMLVRFRYGEKVTKSMFHI